MALDKQEWVFDIPMNWSRNIKSAYNTDVFKRKNLKSSRMIAKNIFFIFFISKLNILFLKTFIRKAPLDINDMTHGFPHIYFNTLFYIRF